MSPVLDSRTRLWLTAGVLLHLALGAAMGLSVDEAHYALYALHPALSYFDHPPLVGWLQWPLVALDVPTALLRLLPALVWLATAWLAARLAWQLAPPPERTRAAGWTVLLLWLSPLVHVLGIGLLPDSLLMLWALLLMVQTARLMDATQAARPSQWLWLGLCLGLAGLSKYTAIFPALAVAACLLAAHGARLLRWPRAWGAMGLAVLLVMPVLLWNQQHQWVSFAYQAQHGAGSRWQIGHVLQFVLVQVLVFGPLLLWGLGRGVLSGLSRWLLLFFALPFGILMAMSGGGSSLPHWTAPAWVALAPLAGIALAQATRAGIGWLLRGLLALQALVCALLLGLMLSGGGPLIAAFPRLAQGPNPFADLHGWDAAGARARELAAQQHLGSVAVQNWTLASRLAWYARPLPVQVLEDRFDQFDLWAADLPPGGSTLLVDWSQMAYEVPLGTQGFARCELLDTQTAMHWGYPLSSFSFYACHGWSGQPAPRLRGEGAP